MRKAMLPYRDMRYMIALVADQAPGNPANAYWLNFFGRPTPLVRGPERGARAGNIPALFAEIFKVKRGYYRARIVLGTEKPLELPEGELTRQYVHFLENCIIRNPSMYLWSHRRWKYGWKEEYRNLWIGE
jgi:KDO2-lipid IV(A) lauroyltransferase